MPHAQFQAALLQFAVNVWILFTVRHSSARAAASEMTTGCVKIQAALKHHAALPILTRLAPVLPVHKDW